MRTWLRGHRWGVRLGVVALVAMVALGSAVRPAPPAAAAASEPVPGDPGAPGGGGAADAGEGSGAQIDGTLWAACKVFTDILEYLPIDPRRPLDVTEWKIPPEVAANLFKTYLSNLRTAVEVAVGSSVLGRALGIGTPIEQYFAEQIRSWRPPSGKYAPDWYTGEIRNHLECELTQKVVAQKCDPVPRDVSVEGAFLPDRCWGTYPTNNYDLGYNQGSPLTRGVKDLWGVTANLLFSLAAGAIQVGLWLMGWAFSLDMRRYNVFALGVGRGYQNRIIGPFNLEHAAWLVLVGWAGFTTLRNRAGMAAGELAVSAVMVGVTGILMANAGDYLDDIWDRMDEASSAVLAAANDESPCEPTTDPHGCEDYVRATLAPTQRQIQEVFIEEPYDYLNWGEELEGNCAEARDHIVSIGPHGDDGWPRRHMERAGPECVDAARFNADPNSNRWWGAFLNLIAAGTVFVILALSSITLLLAKIMAAFLFAVMPFAAVAAIMPGGMRRLAWQWLGALVQSVLAVVGISVLFSTLLIGMRGILGVSEDFSLVERWLVIDIFILAAFAWRKSLIAGTQSAATTIADKLTRLTPGGANAGSVTAGLNIGASDQTLTRASRNIAMAGAAVAASPVTIGGPILAQRLRERRMGRMHYRNLQRHEHWKRGLHEPMYERTWRRVVPDAGAHPDGGSPDDGGGGPAPTPTPTPGPRPTPTPSQEPGGTRRRSVGKPSKPGPGAGKPRKGNGNPSGRRAARKAKAGPVLPLAPPPPAPPPRVPAQAPRPSPPRAPTVGPQWVMEERIVQTGRLPADVPGMQFRGSWGDGPEGKERVDLPHAVGRRDRARMLLGEHAARNWLQ